MSEPGRPAVPGLVLDADDLDAKLIRLRVRGQPHFTGGDMDLIERHYGRPIGELSMVEMQTATAYVYLRRAQIEGATWEMAADQVAVEVDQGPMDPTGAGPSATSPPCADIGAGTPGTSTG